MEELLLVFVLCLVVLVVFALVSFKALTKNIKKLNLKCKNILIDVSIDTEYYDD